MEVTRKNFPNVLQEVRTLLTRCCLMSFDCEFTGLRGSGIKEDWGDTPEKRYEKLRRNSSEFTLIQFGLCFFVKDETSDLNFEVFPFNFYLFPSYPLGRKVPSRLDRCFRCQPSSLLMLANFGLDFNKWIKEGLPYLRESDEIWWRGRRKELEEPSEEELNQFVGFSQVFKLIADSNIPLVGHSILLDLLHSYSHFIAELPEELTTFKFELHKRLSSLYDTQLLCENSNIRPHLGPSLSLGNVYSTLIQRQFTPLTTAFPGSCTNYSTGNHLHEAGYDAYISGCVFIMLARMLGGERTTDIFEAVTEYKNRVYMFSCESVDSLNLAGSEAKANRDHIFHLTFPKEVKTEDIKNLFSPFGGCHVTWINDTSARVSLHHRTKAEEAYKAIAEAGPVDGKLFNITRESNVKPVPKSDAPTLLGTSQLGKRKSQHDSPLHAPAPKVQIFDENSDW